MNQNDQYGLACERAVVAFAVARAVVAAEKESWSDRDPYASDDADDAMAEAVCSACLHALAILRERAGQSRTSGERVGGIDAIRRNGMANMVRALRMNLKTLAAIVGEDADAETLT